MKIISRKEAKAKGLKRYFTGKRCPRDHVSERLVSNYGCIECFIEYQNSPEGNAKLAERSRRHYSNNKEQRIQYEKEYRKTNKDELAIKKKIYRRKNKKEIAEQGCEYYQKNKKRLAKYFSDNKHEIAAKAIIRNNSPAKYKTYAHKLLGHRCRNNGSGLLEVKCKHCSSWYKPTNISVSRRVSAINGKAYSFGVENNLYCSDKCKSDCDLYNMKKTPKSLRKDTKKARCNQPINKKSLLEIQIDKHGYTFCEKCGTKTGKLTIHHGIMVAENHNESDNMAHQVLLCDGCHKKPEAHCRETR